MSVSGYLNKMKKNRESLKNFEFRGFFKFSYVTFFGKISFGYFFVCILVFMEAEWAQPGNVQLSINYS